MAGLFDRRFATDSDSGGFVVKHSSSGRPTVVGDEARLQAARLGLHAGIVVVDVVRGGGRATRRRGGRRRC